MSILSRRGLSIVRYILLAFEVVFVCLLFCFLGGGKEGVIYFSVCCWLLFVVVFCFVFLFVFCFVFWRNKVKYIEKYGIHIYLT